jgi:hypothetical protein
LKTTKAIRWTRERAASEFKLNPRTLVNRLRQQDIFPNREGKYTTLQICAAVFGDIDGEKLSLVREQRIKLQLENQEAKGELIRVDSIAEFLGKFLSAAKQRILSNLKLDDDEKDKILKELQQCAAFAGAVDSSVAGAA